MDRYTYRVSWSAEDGEFVATCIEFPGLSWLAPDALEALAGVRDVVTASVDDMLASGEQIPEAVDAQVAPSQSDAAR